MKIHVDSYGQRWLGPFSVSGLLQALGGVLAGVLLGLAGSYL